MQSSTKHFNILEDVSAIIPPGRMTLLLGPPGSGKSTLLAALAGKLQTSNLKVSTLTSSTLFLFLSPPPDPSPPCPVPRPPASPPPPTALATFKPSHKPLARRPLPWLPRPGPRRFSTASSHLRTGWILFDVLCGLFQKCLDQVKHWLLDSWGR